jgi:hypothetical protein
MTTGAGKSPFKNPLAGRYGNVSELMASLTDDEMLEYIRSLNWSRARQKNSYGHWWIGKEVCAGERELDRRGIDPYSWRTSRTPDDDGTHPDTSGT